METAGSRSPGQLMDEQSNQVKGMIMSSEGQKKVSIATHLSTGDPGGRSDTQY